jgi:mRNA interferase YafQ
MGEDKRVRPPRASDHAKEFSKDWERLSRTGRYDMRRLKNALMLLTANDAPLGPEWKDHPLKGKWSGTRECHVGGDFLLVYKVDDGAGKSGTIVFLRAWTHSEIFKE